MINKPKIKYVILDLDQTITTDTGSWSQFTSLIGADSSELIELYEDFKSRKLSYEIAKKGVLDCWRKARILDKKYIKDVFDKINLREGAYNGVQYLKSKYHVCIISGAINIFVEVISKKLGIEDFYASTKFKFDENDILIDFDYTLSRGEEKLIFFQDFCRKYNALPENCSAIGDGDSDIPIFKKVAYPILFLADETTEENKKFIKIHISKWNEITRYL